MSARESKPSQKPENAAEKLTDRLLVYSSFKPDQYAGYVAAFRRMLGEFSHEKVEFALRTAIDETPEFPPSPARIRLFIPRGGTRRPTCAKCADTEGYLFVKVRHSITGLVEEGVTLCDHSDKAEA